MDIELDFSGQYKYEVRVHHAELGDLGEASLTFGASEWPHLSFDDWGIYHRLGDGMTYRRLQATTKDGSTFTLLDCQITGYSLSVDYVIAGDVSTEFKSIGVRFDDINEWYVPLRKVKDIINAGSDQPDRCVNFSVSITSENQSFNLSSKPVVKISKSGEDHFVHEHFIFEFECTSGFFKPSDIQEKTHELCSLLSILLAVPLGLTSVLVSDADGTSSSIFFPTGIRRGEQSSCRKRHEFFAQKKLLDQRWQMIFERFYRSKFKNLVWVRLAGMSRYEGFWEYRALGYVSLLERYVDICTDGIKREQSKAEDIRDTKVHEELKAICPPLSSEQEDAVFAVMVKNFMGGKKLNFSQKLDHVLLSADQAIRSVVNFGAEDFYYVKQIRDAVAHGGESPIENNDFSRAEIVISKITLFLTYWAFIDFGLTYHDFLQCMCSHNQLRFTADIDDKELDRATQRAAFFTVEKTQFDALSAIKGIKSHSCFLLHADGAIEYSPANVAALEAWLAKPQYGVIPIEEIFGVSKERVICPGIAYIECGAESLELAQAYFIAHNPLK